MLFCLSDSLQIFVGSFEPDDYAGFQTDVDSAVQSMKAAGVTKLLVDVTNNGGGTTQLYAVRSDKLMSNRIHLFGRVPRDLLGGH